MFRIKHKKRVLALSIVIMLLLATFLSCAIYLGDYYHASEVAQTFAAGNASSYTVERSGNALIFRPAEPQVGLIFYPGGKVDETAYAPLMAEFAEQGVLCVLLKMPFHLAVLDLNAADGIREDFPELSRWYIGGHSLGGAMAASYAGKHADEFEGLILLGAYSTADLSSTGLCVISLYGSEDLVMNREKYASNRKNLPADAEEEVIPGGCHSYFGDYGLQKGDGTPTVTRQEQIRATVEFCMMQIRKRGTDLSDRSGRKSVSLTGTLERTI